VRRPLIAIGVIALLVGAAAVLSYVLRIGPLAPPAAGPSVVFVAISRSTDEADAHEIEAIDLAAGTRQLFDAGARITAIAIAPDRRSLYVGLDAGRVALLDATTGSEFGRVDLGGPGIASLSPSADGRWLYAVTVTNVASAVVPIDLAARKAGDPIALPSSAGAAVLRGDTLLVPVGDVRGLQVAFVDVIGRTVAQRLTLPRGTLVPPAAFAIDGARTGIVAFDPTFAGGAGVRVYEVSDPLRWTAALLQGPLPQGPARQVGFGLQAVAAADGTVHVCTSAGAAARRYVLDADLKAIDAGADCGPMAAGADLLMATRAPSLLMVMDTKTGKMLRTLPLAGVPARLVH